MKYISSPNTRRLEAIALGIILGYIGFGVLKGGLDFYQHLGLSTADYLGRYAYPQWLTALFRFLFSSMPPQLAFAIYATVSGLVLFTAYRAAAPSPRWLLGLCVWPLSLIVISYGQTTPYLLLGLVLALSRRGLPAGVLSSLLWLKPQLALGIGLLQFSRRDWPAMASFTAIGVVVILSSLFAPGRAALGADYWRSWFFQNPYSSSVSGLIGFWPIQIFLFASAMILALWLAWRKELSPDWALFLNLGFVPYLLDYDLPLLSPVIAATAPPILLFLSTLGLRSSERGWIVPFGALALLASSAGFFLNIGRWWVLPFWTLVSIPVLATAQFTLPAQLIRLTRILAPAKANPDPPGDQSADTDIVLGLSRQE